MFTSSVAFKTIMYNYCLIEKPMTGTVDVFVYEPPALIYQVMTN